MGGITGRCGAKPGAADLKIIAGALRRPTIATVVKHLDPRSLPERLAWCYSVGLAELTPQTYGTESIEQPAADPARVNAATREVGALAAPDSLLAAQCKCHE
jgi:hypothetical protein